MKKIEAAHTYHCLYLAIHRAHKEAPDIWKIQDCTRILTAIMAVRSFAWHVVGITPAAFEKYRESDFKRPKEKITRAHLKQRMETARSLMEPSEPYVESEFFKLWLENDKTVLCVRGENKTPVPPWEDIENPDGELFPSTLGGFRYGPREQEHLRAMAMKFSSRHVPHFSRPSTSSDRKPPLPELMAAVECYNSIAKPGFPAVGVASYYRQIRPSAWPSFAQTHYEFYQTKSYLGAELHIESDVARPLSKILAPLAGKSMLEGKKQLLWDSAWNSGRGRLKVQFAPSDAPSEIAISMKELIDFTYQPVTEELNKLKKP